MHGLLALLWVTASVYAAVPVTSLCNRTQLTCCVWNDTNIADVLDVIDSSGWTILIDACGRNTPPVNPSVPLPLACPPSPPSPPPPPIRLVFDTGYITTANTAVRSMQSAIDLRAPLVATESSEVPDADYPCAVFVVQAPNVSIEFFTFDISACVSLQVQTRLIGGISTQDIWAFATPVIVQDRDNNLQLTHLSELTLLGGGDAVARFLPHDPGDIISVDGSQFVNVIGCVNGSSPISGTYAVVVAPASGAVTVSGTSAIGFGGTVTGFPLLGPWLGVQVGVQPPSCVPKAAAKCPTCKDPHPDTAMSITVWILLATFITAFVAYLVYVISDRVGELEHGKKEEKKE